MIRVRARVRNGRLVVDEPTDLPDGTELELVPLDVDLDGPIPTTDPLSSEESAKFVSHDELRARLAAHRKA